MSDSPQGPGHERPEPSVEPSAESSEWGAPPSDASTTPDSDATWAKPPSAPLAPRVPLYSAPAPSGPVKRMVTGLGVLMCLAGVFLISAVVILSLAESAGEGTGDQASCRAERANIIQAWGRAKVANTNGPAGQVFDYTTFMDGGSSLTYYAPPTDVGAARIATAKLSPSKCAAIAASELGPVTPNTTVVAPTPTQPDSVDECRAERGLIILAWNSAADANAADPSAPKQTYAAYLENPTPQFFELPSATGAPRRSADLVSAQVCEPIAAADLH